MPDFCEMLPHNPCRVRRGAGGGGGGRLGPCVSKGADFLRRYLHYIVIFAVYDHVVKVNLGSKVYWYL